MATDPSFAATPHTSAVLTNATADTSETAPTNVATVFTAGASGSKIEQIRITQIVSTTSAGVINIFIHDGSTYHLLDFYPYPIATVSTTAGVLPVDFLYNNLAIPSGYSIRVTNTVQGGSGPTAATHKVIAFGGDF